MNIKRVALIYNDRPRPETTGFYCLRALKSLVASVDHFRPEDLHGLKKDAYDAHIRIDDGLEYELPDGLIRTAHWAIDTHINPDAYLRRSRHFDLTFAAQRPGCETIVRAGFAAQWLPLACDPEIHAGADVPQLRDLCFVGNVFPGEREDLINFLRLHYPQMLVTRAYFEEMAAAYASSRIVFNRSIADDINMRVFEALSCGAMLVTNELSSTGQNDLFRDGVHLATYSGSVELLEKVKFYLRHEGRRQAIAKAGRTEVHGRHTYRHRMETVLRSLESLPVTKSVAPQSESQATPDSGSGGGNQESEYFSHARPEILERIPPSAKTVLDVGCGAGILGASVKTRQRARVIGIEMNSHAASAARRRLDKVFEGDAEAITPNFSPGEFDAVVCGDVLEHMRDPAGFLKKVRAWLHPDGRVIASIPNVRHHSVVRNLLDGHWTYESAGLLDETHLRFFTRREVEKLFFRSGFQILSVTPLPGPDYEDWNNSGRPGKVTIGGLTVSGLPESEAEEFFTYQFLIEASPVGTHTTLTSIVILTFNELAFTKMCVDSLKHFTDESVEFIFVDNGSSDETPRYLQALAARDSRVKVILNTENRGFPAGANQGIQASAGSQIVLLNNDTIATTGWLRRMLDAMAKDPRIGLVGPCSNCVSGGQQIAVGYDDLSRLDGFAWDWGVSHTGEIVDTDRLVGFCLLIRRELIDRIGLLDERFGVGCFEDDDYSKRAIRAGYRAVIARDSFVHHFGSRSFLAGGFDMNGLMRANEASYRRKWEQAGSESSPGMIPDQTGPLASASMEIGEAREWRKTTVDQPKVLLLAHVDVFRDRLDKSHYLRYAALARRKGVVLFGPGLPGYRRGMSVEEAIKAGFAHGRPDFILHGCDAWSSGIPLVSGLRECKIPKGIELLDSWTFQQNQIDFIRENQFQIGFCQEGGHHLEFYRQHCPDTAWHWAPNAVDVGLFRDHGSQKDYDIICYGAINPEVYPLRARLTKLLSRQNEFKVLQIPHPGYYPKNGETKNIVSGSDLSLAINRAWFGIATSSIYQCFLMKYLEIAASRALVAGNMPETGRPIFGDHFLELALGDTDDQIMRKFREALADKKRLRAQIDQIAERVDRNCSTESFADNLLATLSKHLNPRIESPTSRPSKLGDNSEMNVKFAIRQTPKGLLLSPQATQPLISLCLIARDNAGTIEACLQSIKPWVDEMVVVDTGSVDSTPRIAERLGAKVFHFPWCDDFSAARNESLRHANGRWLFWMDSDDVIDEKNGRELKRLASGEHADDLLGYVIKVHCPGPNNVDGSDMTVVDHVKLIRNRPDLRFECRIHEQILPAIRRAGGNVAWTDLFVVHAGYDHSERGQARKLERDFRLLDLENRERPNHPFTLFNLGMTCADTGEFERAIGYLRESISVSTDGESHVRKAYSLLVYSLTNSGQAKEAEIEVRKALRLFPKDEELRFRLGIILHELGRFSEAVEVYEELILRGDDRHFTSADASLRGFKARQNLALVACDMNDWDKAIKLWKSVVEEIPSYRQGWKGLGDAQLAAGRVTDLQNTLREMKLQKIHPALSDLFEIMVLILAGESETASERLISPHLRWPKDVEILLEFAKLSFEQRGPAGSLEILKALSRLSPNDPATWHNLGISHFERNELPEAIAALTESLRLRPVSQPTTRLLEDAKLREFRNNHT